MKNIMTPIIPFDMIVDTDYGLIRYINELHHDKDIYYSSILSAPQEILLYLLYSRKERNPLSVVLQDTAEMDFLYNQFMKEDYEEIIKRSILTDFYNAVTLFMSTEYIIPTILCKNEIEEKYIQKINKDLKIAKELVAGHDPIYLKYYEDTLSILDMIDGKNLYIANCNCNMIEIPSITNKDQIDQVLLPEVSYEIAGSCVVHMVSLYRKESLKIPLG